MGGNASSLDEPGFLPDDTSPTVDPPSLTPADRLRLSIVRRPAAPAAVLLMLGIALHAAVPIGPIAWAALIVLAVLAAIVSRARRWIAGGLLAIAVFSAGVALAQLEAFYYDRDHIGHYATDTPRLAQLELQIDQPPRVLANAFGQFRVLPPKQVTLAHVTRVRTWNGWQPASGKVLVQIAEPHPRLSAGQTVRALGRLQRPAPAANPGQFDWAAYYREQRVLASLQILQADNLQIINDAPPPLLTRWREAARQALAAGFTADRSLDHALLRALLLGDSDPELRDVQDQFKRTGTSHHLAISGLHVAVLSGVVLLILRRTRLTPRWVALGLIGFVLLYGAMAMPSPPVLRSVLLFAIVGVGALLGRSTDFVQLLCVAVIGLLIWHPLDLFNAGFQLSFGTVLGLMLLTEPLLRQWSRLRGDEPFRPPRQPLHQWADELLTTSFAAGLVAWLISMPLIALHFSQLNPYAIPAGIVLAPIVFAALIGGFAKVLLTLAFPSLAGEWATLATYPMAWMRWVVDWLAKVPGSDVPLPAPPLWLVLVYFGAVLFLLIPGRRPKWQQVLRLSPAGVCLVVMFLPLWTGQVQLAPTSADPLRVTLLAIGAGQTAVVQTPGGRVALIDAGSMALTDLVRKCLAPFLRVAGEREVDTVVLTHGDYDHISAVADVVNAYDVGAVYIGPRFRHHAVGNAPAEALLRTLDARDAKVNHLSRGSGLSLGRDVKLEVLWPSDGAARSSNDDAVVLRLTYAGVRILFPGDIQADAQKQLLQHPEQLQADVLIAPHHGSSESNTAAFIDAVSPRWILSSNDRTLTGKQRRFETLIGDRPLLRTNEWGAITVEVSADGQIKVDTFWKTPVKSR